MLALYGTCKLYQSSVTLYTIPLTSNHARQLAQEIAEHQRFFYMLRRRMVEWGFSPSDETLAMVAKTDELLSELRTQVYFLGYDAENDRWR